jgi:hypothetical protein
MRHYLRIGLRLTAAPRLLTRGVLMRPTARTLISGPRTPKRRLPRLLGAPLGAVHMPVIAIAADAHLHSTARTHVLPVAPLAHRTPQNSGQIGAVRA